MYINNFLVSFVFALLRNLVIQKDALFSYQEVKDIICLHYQDFYYLANVLFSLCIYFNNNQTLRKIGIDFILCIATLILYFKVYSNHMKRQSQIKWHNIFNHAAFKINISFILAWNVCFLTITAAGFITSLLSNNQNIYYFNLAFQFLLTLICILELSYYSDAHFCFIILIFQMGNTLNKHLFSFEIKDSEYVDKHNFHLLLTLITMICLIGSILKNNKGLTRQKQDLIINEIKNSYDNEVDQVSQ